MSAVFRRSGSKLPKANPERVPLLHAVARSLAVVGRPLVAALALGLAAVAGAQLAAPAAGLPAAEEAAQAQGALPAAATPGSGEDAVPEDGGTSLLTMFEQGGFLMWPILMCSIVMVAFALERAVGLRTSANFPPALERDLRELARVGDTEGAIARCSGESSPFSRLMLPCLQRAGNGGFEMETAMEDAGARVLYDLRRNCKSLAIIADIAPLLGLMGTVTGMIKAFDVVARTGALGRTELLAEGISEALLTTAFGLFVAVPAVLLYHYFRAKADNLLQTMENAGLEILATLRHAGRGGANQ